MGPGSVVVWSGPNTLIEDLPEGQSWERGVSHKSYVVGIKLYIQSKTVRRRDYRCER